MRKIVRKYKGGTKDIKTYQEGGRITDPLLRERRRREPVARPPAPVTRPPAPANYQFDPTDHEPAPDRSRRGDRLARKMAKPGINTDRWNKLRERYNRETNPEIDFNQAPMKKGGGIFGKDYKKQNKKHKLTNPGKRSGGKQYRRKAGK